jgi:tetratricopeptide (TPR) repeat protein
MRWMSKPVATIRGFTLFGVLIAGGLLAGCDLLTTSQTGRHIRDGNEAVVRGEVQKALQSYEKALDGTLLSAEAHYRLGLLFEDQMKNEVGALHHFERYLELAPQGQFATDVKTYVDRLRLTLVSRLAEGTVLPANEASRLRNDNLALRQQVAELRQQPETRVASTPAPTPAPAMIVAATPQPAPVAVAAEPEPEVRRAIPVNAPAGGGMTDVVPRAEPVVAATTAVAAAEPAAPTTGAVRTYKVERGDTLAGIARKFYRNSGQWPKIAEANKATLPDPTKLQPGMILVIPE